MNDNLNKIKLEKAALLGDPDLPETKNLIENGPGGRKMHDAFIIWDNIQRRDTCRLMSKKIPGVNFEVILEEMTFNVTHSKPTGRDNLVVSTNTSQFGSNTFSLSNQEAANSSRRTRAGRNGRKGDNANGAKKTRSKPKDKVLANSGEPEVAGAVGDAGESMDVEEDVQVAPVDGNIMEAVGIQPDDKSGSGNDDLYGDVGGPVGNGSESLNLEVPVHPAAEDVAMEEVKQDEVPNQQDEGEDQEQSSEEDSQIPEGLSDYKQPATCACVIIMRNFRQQA